MSDPVRIPGDLIVAGTLRAAGMDVPDGSIVGIPRTSLDQEPLVPYPIDLTDLRVWDAFQTNLPGTSASDDLGLYGGTFGTNSPSIKTYDLKAAGATNVRARFLVQVPAEYDPGETIKIRAKTGMVTTVADVSATIDFEVYKSDRQAGIGSDLCATAAQSINSLTAADKDFVITATSLSPGDWLDIRVTIAINDAATATAVIGLIGSLEMLYDIRG